MKPKSNFVARNKELNSSKKKLPEKEAKEPPRSIPQKVERLEKLVDKMQIGTGDARLQQMLLDQVRSIKSELRDIKQQIGFREKQEREEEDEPTPMEPEIVARIPNIPRISTVPHIPNVPRISTQPNQETSKVVKNQMLSEKPKTLIEIGKVQPYLKDFKLEPVKEAQPQYFGYHKKSSKAVIVKYCSENESMDTLIGVYERLWKNIVKAKKLCINKIYDLHEPLASYIMVLQRNKTSLLQMELSPQQILKDLVRAVQFVHDCGYLYRNIHPDHVMLNENDQVVILDFKNVRRFVDIKGKHIEVKKAPGEIIDDFTSNARLRGLPEGRKDDLECLGYLGLYLMDRRLPWNIDNIVQLRSKTTLKQLYGQNQGLLTFMASVHRLGTEEMPNYDALCDIL